MIKDENSGVRWTPSVFVLRQEDLAQDAQYRADLLHSYKKLMPNPTGKLQPDNSFHVATRVPVCAMPQYLPYMHARFTSLGGRCTQREVTSVQDAVGGEYGADVVVNCSGLGARTLAGDTKVFALAGHMILIDNASIKDEHKILYYDEDNPDGYTYFMPRQDGCVLGGSLDREGAQIVDEKTIQGILGRIDKLRPELNIKSATIKKTWVGVRPARAGGPRIDVMKVGDKCVINNYGHGGMGVTLSWISAYKVADLMKKSIPSM